MLLTTTMQYQSIKELPFYPVTLCSDNLPRHRWLFSAPAPLSFSSFFHLENHKETSLSIQSTAAGFWVQFFVSGSIENGKEEHYTEEQYSTQLTQRKYKIPRSVRV